MARYLAHNARVTEHTTHHTQIVLILVVSVGEPLSSVVYSMAIAANDVNPAQYTL